jgi:hypothetical protein
VYNNRVDVRGIFLGSTVELGNLLAPILAVPNGTCTQTQEPFSQWFHSNPGAEQPFQKYSPMWVFKPFPREALESILQFMLVAPSDESNFFSLAWGGRTRVEPAGGTAFPRSHRRAIFYAEPGAEWSDAGINAQALTWVEGLRLALQPFFHGGYVNVLDRCIAHYGQQYYGRKNFARLQRIKQERDPHNVFHFEQSIPLCNNKDKEKKQHEESLPCEANEKEERKAKKREPLTCCTAPRM